MLLLCQDPLEGNAEDLAAVGRPAQTNARTSRANNWYHSAILHRRTCDIAAIRSGRSADT